MRVGLDAAIQQADALARKGSPTEALALMENAARDYPNNARAWLVLGRARARVHTNDLAGAEAALRTAVKLAPQSFENRVELGLALFGEKKFSDAAKCFRAVIQIKPDLASAYYNLALCLVQLHENAEALVHAHHAVRLDPADTRARSLVEKLQQPRAAISAKP